VRFQFLTAESIKMAVFWVVGDQGDLMMEAASTSETSIKGATTQKTAIIIK
jgi:hypothetical protein